jgi:hypothetical protein
VLIRKVGIEVNVEKTKYTFISHYKTAVQNHNAKVGSKFVENVPEFKYFGIMVSD